MCIYNICFYTYVYTETSRFSCAPILTLFSICKIYVSPLKQYNYSPNKKQTKNPHFKCEIQKKNCPFLSVLNFHCKL